LLIAVHDCLETADPLSDSFAKFRKLFRPEHQQGNSENNQQMHGLKQSFNHAARDKTHFAHNRSDVLITHGRQCKVFTLTTGSRTRTAWLNPSCPV